MATSFSKSSTFFHIALFASCFIANASDPNILSDFITTSNVTTVDGNFFTFRGMRGLINQNPPNFTVTKATLSQFPAKIGQSVSLALLQFPGEAVNPPHIHPRSAELLFVVSGSLQVGFIDTANKLYTQKLQVGDMFLFPKGLVHFQMNGDLENPAIAVSGFGSADAGIVSVPLSVFGSGVDDAILAKAFKTDVDTVEKIKVGFATPKA